MSKFDENGLHEDRDKLERSIRRFFEDAGPEQDWARADRLAAERDARKAAEKAGE